MRLWVMVKSRLANLVNILARKKVANERPNQVKTIQNPGEGRIFLFSSKQPFLFSK